MGKIDDNGTMRDPSTEEQTSIDNKIGGGTGRFELIDSVNISESIYRIPRVINNYDELFIDISEVQGTGNLVVQAKVGSTTTTTRLVNFLSSSDKSAQVLLQRVSESFYLITTYGTGTTTTISFVAVAEPDSVSYDDKINALIISTGAAANLFTKGKIKIYGRMLNNG